jgi:thiamine biosynthesis protein ThiI
MPASGLPDGGKLLLENLLLIRYGEIALKGQNRPFFEKKLFKNIEAALQGLGQPFQVEFIRGRYYVTTAEEHLFPALRRLQKVCGIVSISPVSQAELSLDEICRQAAQLLASCQPETTFKVNTRRANKKFPYLSPEVNKLVGAYLLKNYPELRVDVHNPEIPVNIEIREKKAYLYSRVFPGPGGLPVGVTGKGLLLLSGGIDSPVAGWMALKRGVEIEALHFHSPPFTGEGAINKVLDLCQQLASYGQRITLHLAPFTEIQQEIMSRCPRPLLITLMRRVMFRIAARLAQKRKITVLFTGESLGQVSSQTLENLVAINAVTTLPVLRPLIGFDKEEIVEISREIDTYPISIRPFEDCCTLFIPRHPATRPSLAQLTGAEKQIALEELITSCLKKLESRTILSE